MRYKTLVITFFIVIFFFTACGIVYAQTTNFQQTIYAVLECNDGIDNDSDGLVDYASDPECMGWDDASESVLETSSTTSSETSTSRESSSSDTSSISSSSSSVNTGNNADNGSDNIITQITEEIDNIFTEPRKSIVLNTFVWEPLGEILGLTEEIESLSDAEFTTINMSLLGLMIYPLAAMAITLSVLINVSRKKK